MSLREIFDNNSCDLVSGNDDMLMDLGQFEQAIADYEKLKAEDSAPIKFAEFVFNECSMDNGHFPHEFGFWHNETQKYLTMIELYDLFTSLPTIPKP